MIDGGMDCFYICSYLKSTKKSYLNEVVCLLFSKNRVSVRVFALLLKIEELRLRWHAYVKEAYGKPPKQERLINNKPKYNTVSSKMFKC